MVLENYLSYEMRKDWAAGRLLSDGDIETFEIESVD